jgi:hypothetical protein
MDDTHSRSHSPQRILYCGCSGDGGGAFGAHPDDDQHAARWLGVLLLADAAIERSERDALTCRMRPKLHQNPCLLQGERVPTICPHAAGLLVAGRRRGFSTLFVSDFWAVLLICGSY